MKFIFIRHGETVYNDAGELQGQEIDPSLNKVGREQAKELGEQWEGKFYDLCSSPLKRARETAEIISSVCDVNIDVDDRLKERSFGKLAGLSWDEISRKVGDSKAHEKDLELRYDYTEYGGESAEEVKERLDSFVKEAIEEGQGPVMAVAHAGIIRMAYFLYRNRQMDVIPNASVHEFEIG